MIYKDWLLHRHMIQHIWDVNRDTAAGLKFADFRNTSENPAFVKSPHKPDLVPTSWTNPWLSLPPDTDEFASDSDSDIVYYNDDPIRTEEEETAHMKKLVEKAREHDAKVCCLAVSSGMEIDRC